MEPIFAIVVLYKQTPAESPTLASLRAAIAANPSLATQLKLLIADNSPEPQGMDDSLSATYLHDGENPGLARRYNLALAMAQQHGAQWLLLLDQDTTLTPAYLQEVVDLAQTCAADPTICALVPKLIGRGALQSPHLPQFRPSTFRVDRQTYGVQPGLLRVYNSAAVLRVSALQAIGGFPQTYWLDYLDHAVFHRLQQAHGRIFVLHAELDHDMSIYREDRHTSPAAARRHTNQLQAALRFYGENGTRSERLKHRLDLLRSSLGSIRNNHWSEATRLLRAACTITKI